jgi:hypothetical protein
MAEWLIRSKKENRMIEETPISEQDEYAAVIAEANEEILAVTGGSVDHLKWFMSLRADNARFLRNQIYLIYKSAHSVPLSAFRSLLDVVIASQRHIWTLWVNRDDMPAETLPVRRRLN